MGATGALQVFWTGEELARWLGVVSRELELLLLTFAPGAGTLGCWHQPPYEVATFANGVGGFLAPSSDPTRSWVRTSADVQQKAWGWAMVRGGGCHQAPAPLLELTSLGGGPPALVRRLRARLVDAGFGRRCLVRGPSGGSLVVPVLFSQAALADWRRGRRWVLSRGDLQTEYSPEVKQDLGDGSGERAVGRARR